MKRTLQRIVESASMQNSFKVTERNRLFLKRGYRTEPKTNEKKTGVLHPYKNLHPWKSIDKFSDDLVESLIYNKDGVVVVNKPYGISNSEQTINHREPGWNSSVGIANSVDYTLSDILPNLSKKLGYESLSIVESPERYISGVAILADNEQKAKALKKSLARAQCAKNFAKTYWIVTTRLPICKEGELNLGITKKESPCKSYKQPIILTKWYNNDAKRGVVRTFDVSYRTISNSIENLSSLMEIKCFTTKWHAIRVFASTVLISPILGDKIHGSRVKKVMGTYMNISPFVDAAREMPILEQALLDKLKLTPAQRAIIPAHIHLREVILPSFPIRRNDLRLVAPLPYSFQWTCDQLKFKIPTEQAELPPELRIAASQ